MSNPVRPRQVYQIDFTAVASGKRIASTKRRVRWRFGFANMEALSRGQTGTDCRGEEHDITLVWSVTSGKRLVIADGQEVHYSNNRNGVFDFSWTMRGNHVLKIIAFSSPPISPTPGFRQYDFFVNGQSFFSFPKVYRLGLSPHDPRGHSGSPARLAESSRRYASAPPGSSHSIRSETGIVSLEAPHNHDEEEAYLQEAIRQSLQDKSKEKSSEGKAENGGGDSKEDLLDFGNSPDVAAPPAAPGDPFGAPASSSSDPFAAPPAAALTSAPQSSDPWGALVPTPSSGYGAYTAQPAPPPPPTNGYGQAFAAPPAAPPAYGVSGPFDAPPSTTGPAPSAYGTAPGPAAGPPFLGATDYSNPTGQTPYGNPWGTPPPPSGSAANHEIPPQAPAPATTTNPYAAQPTQPAYGAPQPSWDATGQSNPPQQQPNYGAPVGAETQPFGNMVGGETVAQTPQAFGIQQQPQTAFGVTGPDAGGTVPPAVTPQPQPTPSSLGFGSPPADFSGFSPVVPSTPAQVAPEAAPAAAGAAVAAPAMSSLDQAFSKLVNLDGVTQQEETTAPSNPFESSSTIGPVKSLAEMKSSTAKGATKEIMKSPMPAPGAMVVAANQNGNYASQYGIQPMQQQQQPGYGGYQPVMQGGQYGAQPPPPQQQYAPMYGGQQQQYGQQPPQYQPQPPSQYGQPPQAPVTYGQQQQQPPAMSMYGQPAPQQQQGYY